MTAPGMSLFSTELLAWARSTTHRGALTCVQASATLDNPWCGDRVCVELCVHEGVVRVAGWHGDGCVLCLASAALLAGTLTARPLAQLQAMVDLVHAQLAAGDAAALPGDLAVLNAAAAYPERHDCLLLPWKCVSLALEAQLQHGF